MTARSRIKPEATVSASELLRKRYISGKEEREASLQEEVGNAEIAGLIYDARNQAGLTQQQLAERVGTHKSVISRLEDSDYDGHSLAMLRRIGNALCMKVEVSLRPVEKSGTSKAVSARRSSAPSRPGVLVRSASSGRFSSTASKRSAAGSFSSKVSGRTGATLGRSTASKSSATATKFASSKSSSASAKKK